MNIITNVAAWWGAAIATFVLIWDWLIGDQAKKKKFTPVGFKVYSILEKYFTPVDLVCVTRHNQSSNTFIWHDRAKRYNFFLRGFKYLIIMKKTGK